MCWCAVVMSQENLPVVNKQSNPRYYTLRFNPEEEVGPATLFHKYIGLLCPAPKETNFAFFWSDSGS